MPTLRSIARTGAVLAAIVGVVVGTAVAPASARTTTTVSSVAPTAVGKPTGVTRPADQWVWSGGIATYTVSATSSVTPTYSWEYSADGGVTWKVLAGKTTRTITLQALTARDGWRVRPKVTNPGGSTYGHSALLRVHSTRTDPFPISPDGSFGALTSGWYWSAVQTGHSATAVSVLVVVHKIDPDARVSDLRAAYVDASGTGTAATVTKYQVIDARNVVVQLRATPPAAALASSTGDAWKIRDTVTGEYEYFATR